MNLYVIASSFISAILGAMGIGGGTVLILYLTTILGLEQKQAQGINLLFFVFTGIIAVISNWKKRLIAQKELKEIIFFSLPGLITGFLLLNYISQAALRKLFAAVLLIIGIKTLFTKK